MANEIIMKVIKYSDEEIYPGESIRFTVTRDPSTTEFPANATLDIEIYDALDNKIDTQEVTLETDNLSFKVKYLNTENWTRKKEYNLWARYKDSGTDDNNVVVHLPLRVQ